MISNDVPSGPIGAESRLFGTQQVADEADRVEERGEEDGVRDDAIDERDDSAHDPQKTRDRSDRLQRSQPRLVICD